MPEVPAALGAMLADVEALVGAWAGALTMASSDPAADVSAMSDRGLVEVTEALAAVSKRLDALTVRCAAGVVASTEMLTTAGPYSRTSCEKSGSRAAEIPGATAGTTAAAACACEGCIRSRAT